MKKVSIINNKTGNTYGNKLESPESWIAECIESNAWGNKERIAVPKDSLYSIDNAYAYELSVATNERTIIIAVAEPETPEVTQIVVDIPCEYTITITDATAEEQRFRIRVSISKAINFGNSLMTDFATDNVLSGITASGKTKEVSVYMQEVQSLLLSGSLYAAKDEIDAMIVQGLPSNLSPFITEAKLLEYKQKINDYLA